MTTVRARLEALLGRCAVGAGLLGLVAVAYLVAYARHPLRPSVDPSVERTGWWTWFDQFMYWRSAAELGRGGLSAENVYYPIGYPLLGAPGTWFSPAHAFLPVNLVLVVLIAWLCWRLWRLWLGRTACLALGVVFVATHASVLGLTLVVPWNTIPTQAALLAAVWLLLTRRDGAGVLLLSGLAAATYWIRPGDAAFFAPLLVWSVLRLPTWRERVTRGVSGLALVAVSVAAFGLLNLRLFGTWGSPYEAVTWETVGFLSYPVSLMAYWLLVDGTAFFGEEGTALLFRYPWLFALPAAAWWFVRTARGDAVAVLATVAAGWGFYTCYNDFVPSGIFRYSLIHYLTWSFPLLFGLAGAALVRGWRRRGDWVAWAAAALLAVVATGLHLEEVDVPVEAAPAAIARLPEARPLWIRFPGEPIGRATQLRLDGRPLRESWDFHRPYVETDLRLLLGARATGVRLDAPGGDIAAIPQAGVLRWTWHWQPARWLPERPQE